MDDYQLHVYFDVEAGSPLYGRTFSTPLEEHSLGPCIEAVAVLLEAGKIAEWEVVS